MDPSSFAEKIAGLMARPNQPDQVGAAEIPWYMKYGSRLLGIVGGFFAILFGAFNTLGVLLLDISCLVSGMLQMLAGVTVLAIEAPCCFICLDYVNKLADVADSKPMWNRAALYCVIAIPPIILCPSLGSLFGCGLIFGTGVVYGMMSLGKKASAEEMRNAAIQQGIATPPPPTNDRASIVNNAQPFSFTGAVGTDSNV